MTAEQIRSRFWGRLLSVSVVVAQVGLLAFVALGANASIRTPSLTIEAESAYLTGAFGEYLDSDASGGAYVQVGKRSGNINEFAADDAALFCFAIDQPGTFTFEADVLARNSGSNSFSVRVDYFDPFAWGFTPNRAYSTLPVTKGNSRVFEVDLDKGQHVLAFHLREARTRLDKVRILGTPGGPSPTECEKATVDVVADIATEAATTTTVPPTPTTTAPAPQSSTTAASTTSSSSAVTSTSSTTTTGPTVTTTTSPPTTTTTSPPTTTTTPPPPPPPPPSGPTGTLWSNSFESGTYNGLGFSSDSKTTHDIISDPTGRSGKVLRLTGDTSDGKRSGNRARIHDYLFAADPHNFPPDGYYSLWFYLEDNQTSNNIFQWKQAWSNDLSDPLNRNKWQTRKLLYFVRVNHEGGGNHSVYLRGAIDQASGNHSNSNYTVAKAPFTIETKKWHHLEARYVWSEAKEGRIQVWLNGQLWADASGIRTQLRTTQNSNDPRPGHPTYIEKLRQFAFNNYMITGSGPWTPTKTTIYFDDVRIGTNR